MNKLFAVCCVMLCAILHAEESLAPRAAALKRLQSDYEGTRAALIDALRKAGQDEAAQTAARTKFSTKDFPGRFLEFAKVQSDTESLEACRYVIRNFYIAPERYKAIQLVEDSHLENPQVAHFLFDLVHGYYHDLRADDCLHRARQAKSQLTRGHATYQSARLLIARRNHGLHSADERSTLEEAIGKAPVAELLSDQGLRRITALLRQACEEFGDVDYFDYSLGKRAALDLYELEHLEVGRTAPDIAGKDATGTTFRLREYRGKVVVIAFWAHWCGPCMSALPEETKFVTEMKERPFVWLGVNGDEEVAVLRQAHEKGTVNFRSWHDGLEGPISTKWNVWGWPTMYVIDDTGVIRHKSRLEVDFKKVAPLIKTLVRDLESK